MSPSFPVFGNSGSFSEVYPEVATVSVTGTQDPSHVHSQWDREVHAYYGPGSTSLSPEFACANPECVKGRLRWSIDADLSGLIRDRVAERKDIHVRCGMPYRGKRCLNYATISVRITYKPKAP